MVEMGNFSGTTDRNIDLVFCIDGTGSMSGIIDNLKRHAKRFKTELTEALVEANTNITSLRIKVITFRDYYDDPDAMVESRFFELPVDQADFEREIDSIDAHGGGDAPENGLEALYLAMKSDFYTGDKDRQIIVLFTDADAIPLKDRAGCPDYPADMVDWHDFCEIWAGAQSSLKLRSRLKRLILFAPLGTKYETDFKWNRVTYVPVEPREGLKELDFSVVIKEIVKSATAI